MKYVLGSQHPNRLCGVMNNTQLFNLDVFVKIKWYCIHDVPTNSSNFVYSLLAFDSDSWPPHSTQMLTRELYLRHPEMMTNIQ